VARVDVATSEISKVLAVRNHFYRLLNKHNEWTASFSLMNVVIRFAYLDQ
jgi:hypothetical protein